MSEIQAGILVVDDEPLIRGLLERMLQLDGYLVWTAADGPAAVEIMRQWGNLIDLALIDWCMPLWDGMQTARELCRLDPGPGDHH
jgi:two-component system response regulator (stage 0 sporulation protein F)